jgi:hypothetical protein
MERERGEEKGQEREGGQLEKEGSRAQRRARKGGGGGIE